MKEKVKKIVLCYDFDGTLCSGYMQNQKLISDCNVDIGKFWSDVTQYSKDNKILRTFASYDNNDEVFSDRNLYPIGCIKKLEKILIGTNL